MKRLFFAILLATFAFQATAQDEVTTFILVRHAEKSNDDPRDPSLSEAGVKRAQALKHLLSQAEVSALYSTPYKRTRSTVQPIAEATGLEIQTYDPRSGDFLKEIMEKYKGKTVVVSGHSNTTPLVANLLIGKQKYQQLSEKDYSKVFVVTVSEIGKGTATILTY